jgi:hypothetical protein
MLFFLRIYFQPLKDVVKKNEAKNLEIFVDNTIIDLLQQFLKKYGIMK